MAGSSPSLHSAQMSALRTKLAFAARAPKTAFSINSKGQNDQTGRLFIHTRIINFSRGIDFRKVVQGPVTQRIDGLAE